MDAMGKYMYSWAGQVKYLDLTFLLGASKVWRWRLHELPRDSIQMSFLDYMQSPEVWEGAWHMGKSSHVDVVWMKNKASEAASEGGRDQNMKAKLNSEPLTGIMNADLSSKPLLAISNRDRTKKGLRQRYWNTILPSHRKKERFICTHREIWVRYTVASLPFINVWFEWTLFSSPPNRLPPRIREQGYPNLLCLPSVLHSSYSILATKGPYIIHRVLFVPQKNSIKKQ